MSQLANKGNAKMKIIEPPRKEAKDERTLPYQAERIEASKSGIEFIRISTI